MNLIPFALFSQKIPADLLTPEKSKSPFIKIFLSFFIDSLFILSLFNCILIVFTNFFNTYLSIISSGLHISYPLKMSFITFPILAFTYYTICLYACDGLTLGTRTVKKRICTKSPLKTASRLTLNLLVLGLSYKWIKSLFRERDYRYQSLVNENYQTLSLHSLLHKKRESEDEKYFIYDSAA